jgi:hypothetical protein
MSSLRSLRLPCSYLEVDDGHRTPLQRRAILFNDNQENLPYMFIVCSKSGHTSRVSCTIMIYNWR